MFIINSHTIIYSEIINVETVIFIIKMYLEKLESIMEPRIIDELEIQGDSPVFKTQILVRCPQGIWIQFWKINKQV